MAMSWGQESNGWQTRLANSVEDRGALFAPLLLRMPDEKRCDLHVLINMWHCQEPYTNACIHAHSLRSVATRKISCICHEARHTRWTSLDAEVHIPIFNNSIGLGMSGGLQYRVVAIVCHFEQDPDSGHYQCLFLSSGSSWMTDDGKIGQSGARSLIPVRRSAYLIWLIPHRRTVNLVVTEAH